jgi:hypothetical protein
MNVIVHIPDELAAQLAAQGGDLERRALEALVLEEFRAGRLSKAELQRALSFKVLNEVDGFLRAHGVFEEDTLKELGSKTEAQRAAQQAATGKALAAEFRVFRRGRTLGGLDPKQLIREGLR